MADEVPPQTLPQYSEWLSTSQLGAMIGVPNMKVKEWITTGLRTPSGRIHLVAVKVGGHWRIEPVVAAAFAALPAVREKAVQWKAGCESRNKERAARRDQ